MAEIQKQTPARGNYTHRWGYFNYGSIMWQMCPLPKQLRFDGSLAFVNALPRQIALRQSNPFGLKWKIACLTVLKKLDNFLIACTFSPCNPTYFLI